MQDSSRCFLTSIVSQGALLLVLFNVSHAVEHLLTDKAQGNLASLLQKAPQTATILQATADGQPDFGRKKDVRAEDVHVGSLMLVRPGEQVRECAQQQ